jgi:hypothetical protein
MARRLREQLEKTPFMKFALEVGCAERHIVEFKFNQLCGTLLIRVDDRPVFQSIRLFNEPVREVYHFVIDGREKSDVRIEKQRKPLLGHRSTVYVNDRVTRVIERYF